MYPCESCGQPVEEGANFCPCCGKPLNGGKRYQKPRTIEELKAFCAEKGMPLRQMRFFIGENYGGPRAFGIYRDGDGDLVVYKNKSDGTRAVRYQGPDEAFAVNEIYEKLKAETQRRRGGPPPVGRQSGAAVPGNGYGRGNRRRVNPILILGIIGAVIAAAVILSSLGGNTPRRGYYRYQDHDYYYYNSDWYYYDPYLLDWYLWEDVDPYFLEGYDDYYASSYYDDAYGFSSFEDSGYYDPQDDYDWDSDGGWDSWDSGDTDWDSDW